MLYSSQQADVNVALTTISLLWNAADMFGKAGARAAAARPASASAAPAAVAAADDESDTEVEAAVVALPAAENGEDEGSGSENEAASPSGKSRGLVAQLTAVQTEDLLQMIFLALQVRQSLEGDCMLCPWAGRPRCLFCPIRLVLVAAAAAGMHALTPQPSHNRALHFFYPAAGGQPGCAARGPQQRRAHAVCGGGQPGPPPVARALGAVPVGHAVPAAQPRLPHVGHRLARRGAGWEGMGLVESWKGSNSQMVSCHSWGHAVAVACTR